MAQKKSSRTLSHSPRRTSGNASAADPRVEERVLDPAASRASR